MSVSRVNLENPTSVGIYLRNIAHDPGIHPGNIEYVKYILENKAKENGVMFRDCAIDSLRGKVAVADRQGVKDILHLLMEDEDMSLEDIRDAVIT